MSWPLMSMVKPDLPPLLPVQVIKPGRVTTPFGVSGSWMLGWHPGDDWNGYEQDLGDPVRSSCSGTVVSGNWGRDYGNHVIIAKGNGRRVAFCHLASKRVKIGQKIKAGDVLGVVGMTGNTTGPHCHVEERVPPWRYSKACVRKPTYEKIPGG